MHCKVPNMKTWMNCVLFCCVFFLPPSYFCFEFWEKCKYCNVSIRSEKVICTPILTEKHKIHMHCDLAKQKNEWMLLSFFLSSCNFNLFSAWKVRLVCAKKWTNELWPLLLCILFCYLCFGSKENVSFANSVLFFCYLVIPSWFPSER